MLEDTFSQLHKTYKALPIEATRVIMSQAPAQARPILAVAKEMDEKTVKNIAKDIADIVEAGKKLQDSNTKNADSLSHIDPDAVGRIHSHYKALNNKAKRALIKEIPEQARPTKTSRVACDSARLLADPVAPLTSADLELLSLPKPDDTQGALEVVKVSAFIADDCDGYGFCRPA